MAEREPLPLEECLSVGTSRAAEMIGVNRSTIYRLIERGELPTVQLGGRRLIEVDQLRRLLAQHRSAPALAADPT